MQSGSEPITCSVKKKIITLRVCMTLYRPRAMPWPVALATDVKALLTKILPGSDFNLKMMR